MNLCFDHCLSHCLDHHPEPRSGLCPELLADFRIPKPPGCSQGAQRAVFCAVRVADFLAEGAGWGASPGRGGDRKSTRLNSSHLVISYAVFCLKKKKSRRTARTLTRHSST